MHGRRVEGVMHVGGEREGMHGCALQRTVYVILQRAQKVLEAAKHVSRLLTVSRLQAKHSHALPYVFLYLHISTLDGQTTEAEANQLIHPFVHWNITGHNRTMMGMSGGWECTLMHNKRQDSPGAELVARA